MKKIFYVIVFSFFIVSNAFAAGDALHPKQVDWEFEGIFGTFDRASIQRGFQVYKEVCAACHSLKLLSYRNLGEIGFDEDTIKAIAAEALVKDGPNDDGEMFERPGRASDRFAAPFPNEKAARSANNGAFPPDLSLITKARVDGNNYLYSLLTGYSEPPAEVKMAEGMSYNPYFPGGQIAMAPPIDDDTVEYADGTPASKDQIARDVVNFLQWAAEPEMEKRKSMGVKVMVYLAIFTLLFFLAKKRVWKRLDKD